MSSQRARITVTIGFKQHPSAAKRKDNRSLISFVSFELLRTNAIEIKRWIYYIIFLCFCQIKMRKKENEQDVEQDLQDEQDRSRIYTVTPVKTIRFS